MDIQKICIDLYNSLPEDQKEKLVIIANVLDISIGIIKDLGLSNELHERLQKIGAGLGEKETSQGEENDL